MYKEVIFILVYVLFSAANIISIKRSSKAGLWLTKPFLMPVLALFYAASVSSNDLNWLVILALVSAFFGDCFLLKGGKTFLTAGIFSFLIAHVFYIFAFASSIAFYHISLWLYILLLLYIIYGAVVYIALFPSLGTMKASAFVYIVVILTMSFISLMRMNNIYGSHFWLPYLGSIVFIISDTMVAFNTFKKNTIWREIMVMVTYITAQLMIVLGFI